MEIGKELDPIEVPLPVHPDEVMPDPEPAAAPDAEPVPA